MPSPCADHTPSPSWPTKWRAHSGKMTFSIEPFLVTATPTPLGLLPSAARMPPTSAIEILILLPFFTHGREWMSTGESMWPLRHVVSALVTWYPGPWSPSVTSMTRLKPLSLRPTPPSSLARALLASSPTWLG